MSHAACSISYTEKRESKRKVNPIDYVYYYYVVSSTEHEQSLEVRASAQFNHIYNLITTEISNESISIDVSLLRAALNLSSYRFLLLFRYCFLLQ